MKGVKTAKKENQKKRKKTLVASKRIFKTLFCVVVISSKQCSTVGSFTIMMKKKEWKMGIAAMTLLEKWPENFQALNGIRTHDLCPRALHR